MKDFWFFMGIFVLWIALNRWVLPWFGVSTCMSGNCGVSRCGVNCLPAAAAQPGMTSDKDGAQPKGIEQ